MFHFSSLRASFTDVLLRNKRITSGASLGLIPRSSAAGSFIRDLRNLILFLKTMSLTDKVRLSVLLTHAVKVSGTVGIFLLFGIILAALLHNKQMTNETSLRLIFRIDQCVYPFPGWSAISL